ncbi:MULTISPECIES: ABC transporter permease [Alphaproteobacteria]|jgi:ABC-2 type transport system permease protein|uniref:Inner membrane transport permease YhhJ n=2 Tax=Paracoccaceae TaxID=31989 RepID=A0A3P5WC65_9RHOB|nr:MULTISPECIES: ABC transporter permease [Alphaproteobacteria]SIQ98516.1 ABC-2 type transport system permease protein [Paracoccus thiocyanatus]VDC19266.1 Inner membrane transport permease YhhJ [Pseudogemmobacter humi]
MRAILNIFWLIGKEIKSTLGDPVMVGLILWSFFFAVMMEARGAGDTVHNASIAIVDEDNSPLSRQIASALMPPWFQPPLYMTANQAAAAMDRGDVMFTLNFPPDFGSDAIAGRAPVAQLLADATAVSQAQLGSDYLRNIVADESRVFLTGRSDAPVPDLDLELRRAFNPNGNPVWFKTLSSLLNQLSLLTIVLTGAAMLREREHGTIEHLMVMPLSPVEVALSKVLAVMLIVLVAFVGSLLVVVQGILGVPVAGSMPLLVMGAAVYLWAAAAIGMLLGTLARSMAQFALLIVMTIIPIIMLSGGFSAIESQPDAVRRLTMLLPSRHFLAFAKAVAFRGAGLAAVWMQLALMISLGAAFFAASLVLFRRSMNVTG